MEGLKDLKRTIQSELEEEAKPVTKTEVNDGHQCADWYKKRGKVNQSKNIVLLFEVL
jgi:hypothetical protein